jgi:hypothetical protein
MNITEYDLFPGTTVVLDTRHLNLYFPGIGYHYAPIAMHNKTYYESINYFKGLPARVFGELIDASNWHAYADTKMMTVNADVLMHLNVTLPTGEEEVALQVLLKNLTIGFDILIDEMILLVNIRSVVVQEVVQIFSTFGDINTVVLREGFNTLMIPEAGMLVQLNEIMAAAPLIVPSYALDLFQLSDLAFYYYDDILNFACVPTWIPMPATYGDFIMKELVQ